MQNADKYNTVEYAIEDDAEEEDTLQYAPMAAEGRNTLATDRNVEMTIEPRMIDVSDEAEQEEEQEDEIELKVEKTVEEKVKPRGAIPIRDWIPISIPRSTCRISSFPTRFAQPVWRWND